MGNDKYIYELNTTCSYQGCDMKKWLVILSNEPIVSSFFVESEKEPTHIYHNGEIAAIKKPAVPAKKEKLSDSSMTASWDTQVQLSENKVSENKVSK